MRATVKGMASGRAVGPESLTYEMFQAVLESYAALRVLTDGISTMLTQEGMADSRISRTFKGAITTFLPKPDKEEEELDMMQNQRPITLRTCIVHGTPEEALYGGIGGSRHCGRRTARLSMSSVGATRCSCVAKFDLGRAEGKEEDLVEFSRLE